jgi:hypothetical protein
MIQFPLNHAEKFPWQSVASMAELTDIIDVISLNDLASRMSTRLSIVAFYLCLIWIAAVVVAAIWWVCLPFATCFPAFRSDCHRPHLQVWLLLFPKALPRAVAAQVFAIWRANHHNCHVHPHDARLDRHFLVPWSGR